MKLSNPNVPIIVKSELSKYTDDEKSDETKLCKYESDRLTNSLTNTTLTTNTTTTSHNNSSSINTTTGNSNTNNNNNGPSLGSAIHSMNTLYGIIVALAEFGAQCLRMMVFPLLSSLCHRLTKLTESNLTLNELNELNTSGSNDLKPTQQHPVLSLSLGVKLLPVDQRSFDFLKVMMTVSLFLYIYSFMS